MPSRSELSTTMKKAGYSVPDDTAATMRQCMDSLWHDGGTPAQAEACARQAMGNKDQGGTVAASFASKWTK